MKERRLHWQNRSLGNKIDKWNQRWFFSTFFFFLFQRENESSPRRRPQSMKRYRIITPRKKEVFCLWFLCTPINALPTRFAGKTLFFQKRNYAKNIGPKWERPSITIGWHLHSDKKVGSSLLFSHVRAFPFLVGEICVLLRQRRRLEGWPTRKWNLRSQQ